MGKACMPHSAWMVMTCVGGVWTHSFQCSSDLWLHQPHHKWRSSRHHSKCITHTTGTLHARGLENVGRKWLACERARRLWKLQILSPGVPNFFCALQLLIHLYWSTADEIASYFEQNLNKKKDAKRHHICTESICPTPNRSKSCIAMHYVTLSDACVQRTLRQKLTTVKPDDNIFNTNEDRFESKGDRYVDVLILSSQNHESWDKWTRMVYKNKIHKSSSGLQHGCLFASIRWRE